MTDFNQFQFKTEVTTQFQFISMKIEVVRTWHNFIFSFWLSQIKVVSTYDDSNFS